MVLIPTGSWKNSGISFESLLSPVPRARRVLRFPDGQAIGDLKVRRISPNGQVGAWDDFGIARGRVEIAARREVQLWIDADSPRDLSPLAAFPKDAFDSIRLFFLDHRRTRSIDWLEHFSALRELMVGCEWFENHHIPVVNKLTRLRALHLDATAITDEGVAGLRPSRDLQTLRMDAYYVTHSAVDMIAKKYPKLQTLRLGGRFADDALAKLTSLRELRALDLGWTNVTGSGFESLPPSLKSLVLWNTRVNNTGLTHLGHLRGLRALNLKNTRVTGRGLKQLASFSELELLDIDGLRGVDDRALHQIAGLSNLRTIRLPGGGLVTDDSIPLLIGLTELREIDLCGTSISESGVLQLANLRKLESVEIFDKSLTDRVMPMFAAMRRLATLALSGNDITDVGVKAIRDMPRLTSLWLANTKVTDASVKYFAGMTELLELSLRDTDVTPRGVSKIRNALPHCAVYASV